MIVYLFKEKKEYFGPGGDRTHNLLLRRQTRFHCATRPLYINFSFLFNFLTLKKANFFFLLFVSVQTVCSLSAKTTVSHFPFQKKMRKRKPVPSLGQTPRTPSKRRSRIQSTTIVSSPAWAYPEPVPCDGCQRADAVAVVYCKVCDQCLCARCNEYTHTNGIPSFKAHPLLPPTQRPPPEQRCPKHSHKPFTSFCITCKGIFFFFTSSLAHVVVLN